jgi:hypothetical protein
MAAENRHGMPSDMPMLAILRISIWHTIQLNPRKRVFVTIATLKMRWHDAHLPQGQGRL